MLNIEVRILVLGAGRPTVPRAFSKTPMITSSHLLHAAAFIVEVYHMQTWSFVGGIHKVAVVANYGTAFDYRTVRTSMQQ